MEFKEVMRQWQRMCKSMQEKNMSCKEDCPLGHNPTCGELEYASLEEINNAETVIMKWAAEHPEPVYPTWAEWLLKVGAARRVPIGEPWPVELADGSMLEPCYEIVVKENERIPAYIAEPLGIDPKEDV